MTEEQFDHLLEVLRLMLEAITQIDNSLADLADFFKR